MRAARSYQKIGSSPHFNADATIISASASTSAGIISNGSTSISASAIFSVGPALAPASTPAPTTRHCFQHRRACTTTVSVGIEDIASAIADANISVSAIVVAAPCFFLQSPHTVLTAVIATVAYNISIIRLLYRSSILSHQSHFVTFGATTHCLAVSDADISTVVINISITRSIYTLLDQKKRHRTLLIW